jgi:hypothetical protein
MRMLQTAYNCKIGVDFNSQTAEFWRKQIEQGNDETFIGAFLETLKADINKVTPAMVRRLSGLAENAVDAKAALAAYHVYRGSDGNATQHIDAILQHDIQQQDDYPNHYVLGNLFYNSKDKTKKEYGLKLLQRAANAGNTSALLALGDIYADRKQYPQAIKYYEAAARDHDSAYRKLYHIHLHDGHTPEAVKVLEKLAAQDSAEDMMRLVEHYANDLHDPQKARYWLEQAAVHYPCEGETLHKIAISYMLGINGASLDKQKGQYWLDYLSRIPIRTHNNPVTQARAFLYQEELAEAQNVTKKREALDVLTQLAGVENKEAMQTLLDYYLLQSDAKQAVTLLAQRASKGSTDSMLFLSNIFLTGFADIPADEKKSIYWLRQAEASGSDAARARLALLAQ